MEKTLTGKNADTYKLLRDQSSKSIGKGLPRSNTIGRKEQYPLRTVNIMRRDSKPTNLNKFANKSIPLTTPDRSSNNQNIFNIIFNNSNESKW